MHIRKKRAFENDKFIYQLWHHRGQRELAHDCTMGWCSKEGEKPYFQMRARAYRLVCGAPKSKPRFHLFTFGKAEVRVAFNDRAERYHSRNLVTERDATGELAFYWVVNVGSP